MLGQLVLTVVVCLLNFGVVVAVVADQVVGVKDLKAVLAAILGVG
jgi:hypothetical protein